MRLVLLSESAPLTLAQASLAEECLLRRGFRGGVSSLELTFDVWDTTVQDFRRKLLIGSRSFREFQDPAGRQTLYLRTPTSPWQLRVYQKTQSIVRLEFILRLPFLRAHDIHQPLDVLRLAKLELWPALLPSCEERTLLRHMQQRLLW